VHPPEWQAGELASRGPRLPAGRSSWDGELGQLRTERGRYDQGVRHATEELAALVRGLRERGLYDGAVLALVSDHGEGLWEHVSPLPADELGQLAPREFFYQKHGASQYQEVLATPFVLRGPGVPAGLRIPHPVENVDLFPTLLELADVPTPGRQHGRSLVPHITGEPAAWRRYVFSSGVHGNAVRDTETELKLILPLGNALRAGHGARLFDLAADPHERNDVAGERADDVRRLTAVWREWKERYPTEDNLGTAASRMADREQRRLRRSLGYTELDVGGD
jgi:arylsulfatase A-like enzyme